MSAGPSPMPEAPDRPEDWREQIRADLAAQLEAGGTLCGFRPDGTCIARTRDGTRVLERPARQPARPGQPALFAMPTLHVVAGPNGCGKTTLTHTRWFRDSGSL